VSDLRHHGDVEARDGLLDLAVNVYAGPRPPWLDAALRASLDDVGAYPDPSAAETALARHHGRHPGEALASAGAAEAFTLVARLRPWRRAVVVHPQFTEPHQALLQAGHEVTPVVLEPPFTLDPAQVPDDADLVVVGNPTNPTGVLHPRATLEALCRPGRLVVVDEAFADCVPGETESLAGTRRDGLVVLRSLTKHWGVPGVRAGYVLGPAEVLAELREHRIPWSVSSAAIATVLATCTDEARVESERRAREIGAWREHLETGLTGLGVEHVPSRASFVLARPGAGVHARLRELGVAVRRADTFPGLGPEWVRIAVREPGTTGVLLQQLHRALG
jgi:histidinol-phosphate/aromatic aminotransferase/cobyric acid decarboxylase-like protein